MTDDEGQYKTGYRKPPLNHRFAKGRSGNPRGRPKKKSPSFLDIFQEELEREITVREDDKTYRISLLQAAMRQLVHKAAKGDMRALKYCVDTLEGIQFIEEVTQVPRMIIRPPDGPAPPMPPIYVGDGKFE